MLFLLGPACCGVWSWLMCRHMPISGLATAVVVFCGLAFGLVAASLLRIALTLCNAGARPEGAGLAAAAADGALVLLPFLALAAMADLLLDWNASQAFASAAIMASAAAMGTGAASRGGRRWASSIGLSLAGLLISGAWTAFCALLGLAGR